MSCDAHERFIEWIDEGAYRDFITLYEREPTDSEEDEELMEEIREGYRNKFL